MIKEILLWVILDDDMISKGHNQFQVYTSVSITHVIYIFQCEICEIWPDITAYRGVNVVFRHDIIEHTQYISPIGMGVKTRPDPFFFQDYLEEQTYTFLGPYLWRVMRNLKCQFHETTDADRKRERRREFGQRHPPMKGC